MQQQHPQTAPPVMRRAMSWSYPGSGVRDGSNFPTPQVVEARRAMSVSFANAMRPPNGLMYQPPKVRRRPRPKRKTGPRSAPSYPRSRRRARAFSNPLPPLRRRRSTNRRRMESDDEYSFTSEDDIFSADSGFSSDTVPESPTSEDSFRLSPTITGRPRRRIGEYSIADRARKIRRFLSKKRRARTGNVVKYKCRKKFADARPRVHGRFIKFKKENNDLSSMLGPDSLSSPNPSVFTMAAQQP
eukprot:1011206_1